MAVTKDNVSSTSGTTVASLSLASFVVANQADRCLFAMAGNSAAAGGAAHLLWTWNTTESMTEIHDAAVGSFNQTGAAYLIAPTATTASVSVTFAFTQDEAFLSAYSAYNVDQSTPNGTVRTNTGTTTPAWVSCDGVTDGISLAFVYGLGTASADVDGIPEYISVGTASQSAGATTLTPAAPAGQLMGDLDFASIATENNETISVTAAGWVKLGSTVQQNATWQEELWVRLYTGTNTNPDFSWTSSVGCSARRWLIRDGLASTTLGGFHNTNSGTGTTHTATGANSTGNDSIAMYLSHAEANTALGADAGYVEKFDAGSATGPYRLVVGTRDQATSGAGADNFSATGANASWIMRIIEVQNAANGDQTQETEQDNIGASNSAHVSTEIGATYNTFGWTLTGTTEWGAVAFAINPAVAGGGATVAFHDKAIGRGIARGIGF